MNGAEQHNGRRLGVAMNETEKYKMRRLDV
jgi:hypothetical protein